MSYIFGLPAHPFLVHAAVILIPAVALATIFVAVLPKLRKKFSNHILIASLCVAIYIPIVMQSGEHLEEILGEEGNTVIESHATLGDTSYFIGIALLLVAVLIKWISSVEAKGIPVQKILISTMMALSLIVGSASIVQVARIGHTGAKAVWHDAGEEE